MVDKSQWAGCDAVPAQWKYTVNHNITLSCCAILTAEATRQHFGFAKSTFSFQMMLSFPPVTSRIVAKKRLKNAENMSESEAFVMLL